jgi:hypothetical protein
MIGEKSFLGMEFVTWLWRKSEAGDGVVELPKRGPVEVAFEKDLLLTSEAGESQNSAFKGDTPTLAPEAATALMAGKKVKRARIRLIVEGVNYELSLNGESFDWSGLKIDTPPSLPFNEAVPLRLAALEEFQNLFSALFDHFLELRLDEDAWETELETMRKWVKGKTRGPEEE